MKKLLAVWLILALALGCAAFAEDAPRTEVEFADYLDAQAQMDAALIAEGEAGYEFESPLVVVNPYGNAPLSALAIFTTEEEVGGTVTAKGKAAEDDVRGSFPAAKLHYVPIYGLYAGSVTDVELSLDDGRSTTLQVETEALDLGLRDYNVEMLDDSAYDFSCLTVCGNMLLHCYAGYDSKAELRWALTGTGANAITLMGNGHFLIPNIEGHGAEFPNGLTGVREIDPLGKVYNEYVWNGGEHHDVIELPNGNLLVASSMPGYATDRDYVVEIDPATGEIVWDLDMSQVITPGASGGVNDSGRDWCHLNSLSYNEESDILMISCRHLEAVVAIHKSTKELAWILSDPSGWDEAYAPYLLQPVGENFGYPYGQHQLTLMASGDLLMFDNGEFGRAKLPDQETALTGDDRYSRAVIYRIDPEAMTVEQLWEYGRELGATHFAGSMSGIQMLDEESQSYLIDFGTCEAGEAGEDTATFIEYLVGGEVIWKMDYLGSSTYRAYRLNLYQSDYAPGIAGNWRGDMGETALLDGVLADPSAAEAKLEGVSVRRYPFDALYVSGAFPGEGEQGPEQLALAIVASDGTQLVYDVAYTTSGKGEDMRVRPSRWVSIKGLSAGSYSLYIVMDGETFDTGLDLNI